MQVKRMGIHKVPKKLASGRKVYYYYAWRGGPRIHSEPNTREFLAEYVRLTHVRDGVTKTNSLAELVMLFKESQDYLSLKDRTQRDYDDHFKHVLKAFADLPIPALEERGIRAIVKNWHESMAKTPRRADMRLSALVKLVSFAKDRELIDSHKLERMSRLYKGSRKDIIWTPEHIKTFLDSAPLPLIQALKLGLYTGQRQSDVLKMPWTAYDGNIISITQAKTGARVRIRVFPELKEMLDNMPRKAITILTSESGLPWGSGFGGHFHKWRNKLNLKPVAFTDLRGTFVTIAKAKGHSISSICLASGHSEKEAERILNDHYFAADLIENVNEYRTKL